MHTYARRRLTAQEEALGRLAAFYTELASEQTRLGIEGYKRLDEHRAHFVNVLTKLEKSEMWQAASSLTWAVESYLDIQGYGTERVIAIKAGLSAAEALDNRGEEGDLLGNLGNAYQNLGQVERAIDFHQQALTVHREIGHRWAEGSDLGNLGIVYRDLGQVEQAIECFKESLAILKEVKSPYANLAQELLDDLEGNAEPIQGQNL